MPEKLACPGCLSLKQRKKNIGKLFILEAGTGVISTRCFSCGHLLEYNLSKKIVRILK